MSLIVTGSVGIDSVETPSGRVDEVLGGSAVYFCAAARFFGPVRLLAAVGGDFPERFERLLALPEVDLSGLEKRPASRTFRWHGRYHADLNRRDTVKVELNVLAEKLPRVPEHYRDSQYIFLANTHPEGQIELLEQFPDRRLVVADTMDLWVHKERQGLEKLLRRIDGLVLNDAEARMLSGLENLVQAAEAIQKMGPRFVVIKKGEHGALLRWGEWVAALPAWPSDRVVDPTGAGDSFAGAMMGVLAAAGENWPNQLLRAVAVGTVVASFTIESFSLNRLLEITRQDVDQRLAQYRAMLTVD